MIRTPVESSNLVSVGHENNTLEVEFKGGRVYHYFNVPHERFEALLAAESVGKFLNQEIKPHYHFQFVSDDPAYNLSNAQRQLDPDGLQVAVSRQALDEVLAELRYLRYFRDAAGHAFDPADGDVYWGINEDYAASVGPVPAAYANEEGE